MILEKCLHFYLKNCSKLIIAELEKLKLEMRKIEKKNRALMETQRVYELDRKELQSELQSKHVELKHTERTKKRIEEEARRKIESNQRKLLGNLYSVHINS